MLKTLNSISDLIEADFKVIQKLLDKKYNKEYTLTYIRMVCNGKRTNSLIKGMAEDYLKVKEEEKVKLEKLAS